MNFLEALKSGRPIRRPIPRHIDSFFDGWINPSFFFTPSDPDSDDTLRTQMLTLEDALEEDWQIKPADKVVRWQWVNAKPLHGERNRVTECFYSDAEFLQLCGIRQNDFMKLEYTRTEFDE